MKTEQTGETEFPETLQELMRYFSDKERAFQYMKGVRWPDGTVRCAHCNSDRNTFVSTRYLWKCKDCKKQFTLRLGTIFEDSPIPFDKWIGATWMIANAKNGVSSYEVARSLGVCQKTAWFMLQRIRYAMHSGSVVKLSGSVEVDESWIGGSARNMHKAKKAKVMKGAQNFGVSLHDCPAKIRDNGERNKWLRMLSMGVEIADKDEAIRFAKEKPRAALRETCFYVLEQILKALSGDPQSSPTREESTPS